MIPFCLLWNNMCTIIMMESYIEILKRVKGLFQVCVFFNRSLRELTFSLRWILSVCAELSKAIKKITNCYTILSYHYQNTFPGKQTLACQYWSFNVLHNSSGHIWILNIFSTHFHTCPQKPPCVLTL